MDLITPELGLVVWTLVTFLILLFILRKFAWNPILNSVSEREKGIEEALNAADKAKREMENLMADNDRMKQEARLERDAMLKEAQSMKKQMIAEASEEAEKKAALIIEKAQTAIQNEKKVAISELKAQVAKYSVEIAEKVLQEELKNTKDQKKLVDKYLDDVTLN